jgi:hypothetical protein
MHRRRDVQSTPFLLGGVYQERHPARTLVVTDLRLEPDARTTVIGRWLRHEDPAQRGRLYAILPSDAFTRIDP